MVIRPGQGARVIMCALAPLGATLGTWGIAQASMAQGLVALPLLGGPALFIAVRISKVSVEVRAGDVFVRGVLWSRTIPRSSVSMLTNYPALRWTDQAGRSRWTPLNLFGIGLGVMSPVVAHNTE